MTAPDAIHELVAKFAQHRKEYQSHKNETELRREFLDPFFEALGWDVFNRKSYSERFKEVLHEASVEVEGKAKAADYAFRAGDKTMFFVEAKKPSVNIGENPEPAFQLRRYGWSARLPVSILTDFEQLAVYECATKPAKTDKASFGRVKLYHYSEYVEKWDEIAAVFSREAVLQGAFDQFAAGAKGKKGTAQVDDAFLAEIERWRELLARNIALRNPSIRNERELNYAVQLTIDRIIFLRICEDRGIEPEGQLQSIGNGQQVYAELVASFRRADTRYNSGLFHFAEEKGQSSSPDTLTPDLQIDDKVLKDILRNLYYPESPYVFTYLSADILGQVYERFLGKVIRLTAGHQARVEEKPEVRKAGGVYYTPTYIVDYIVQNTVGRLVEGNPSPGPSPGPSPDGEHVRRGGVTPGQVANLKVLDPACGSGSFLLGAYQYLLDWHLDWYTQNDPEKWARGKDPAVAPSAPAGHLPHFPRTSAENGGGQGGGWRLTTAEKKRILLNNIHGVDIDAQAVEVTKLSLLLKVLEGESGQLRLGFERVLPDLGNNIKCGNSLIGPDYYEGRQLGLGLFDEEEHYRVNAFDWKQAFGEIFAQGGFDAVIGNPPYGADFTTEDDAYFSKKFTTFGSTKDVYTCFIENGVNILSQQGLISFIVPSGWIGGPNYETLRDYLLDYRLDEIILLPFDIFSDAYVDTLVFVLEKTAYNPRFSVNTYIYPKREKLSSIQIDSYHKVNQKEWHKTENKKFILDPNTISILRHIKSINSRTMQDVFIIRRGVLFNKSLLHSEKISRNDFRYFEGDIYRYRINLVLDNWVEFGEKMKERPKDFFWFEGARILLRRLVNRRQRLMACITNDTFITNKNLYSIIPEKIDPYVLLSILNSKLISYLYINQVTQAVKDDFPQVTIKDILSLPCPTDENIQKVAENLSARAKAILDMQQQLSSAKMPQEKEMLSRQIAATDESIDRLVYELYGLTEEEIRIVEGVG